MTDIVAARREVFLRQTIAHSHGGSTDAAVNSWWALRLLDALVDVAPDQLPALLADISDELEMGYAEELASEQAAAAGLDPDAIARHAEQAYAATKES